MQWRFFRDLFGTWQWEHLDRDGKVLGESSCGFPSQADCVADARRCGFDDRSSGLPSATGAADNKADSNKR